MRIKKNVKATKGSNRFDKSTWLFTVIFNLSIYVMLLFFNVIFILIVCLCRYFQTLEEYNLKGFCVIQNTALPIHLHKHAFHIYTSMLGTYLLHKYIYFA